MDPKLLEQLVAPVHRDVDMGEYREELKGKVAPVWVNAPAVVETLWLNDKDETAKDENQISIERRRKVVHILYGIDEPVIEKMDDLLLNFFFNQGIAAYFKYHNVLTENLAHG